MTKTTRLWYVPLADVVEAAGRAALLAAEFVDAKMLTSMAAAKLLRKDVKPGDVLALMDGTQLRALARVLVLEDSGQRWRMLPILAGPKLVSAPAMGKVPDAEAAEIRLPVTAVLRDLDSITITAPVTSPEPPASAPEAVPDDTPFLPFAADTRTQNILLHGPPGTGKTWALKERAIKLAIKGEDLRATAGTDPRKQIDAMWSRCLRQEQVAMCTFHQAYTYEEFVEGIRPMTAADGAIRYAVEDGLFKRISLLALAEGLEASVRGLGIAARRERARDWLARGAPLDGLDFAGGRQFVLVIDEINRANVARVMGELITLIEDDKRIGGLDPTVLHLPASSTRFAVPPNLHIIGTLNTADRSIALMDVALRRRFAFEELAPNEKVIKDALEANKVPEALRTLVVDIFNKLNERVQFLHDREHRIGHAYFLKIRTLTDLRDVLVRRVIPLLQEYFFGHWTRLALALAHPMQPGGQAPGEPKDGEATVLEIKKIKEKDVIGVDHDDFEDQYTVEVHPDFLKDDTAWLARALFGVLRAAKPPTQSQIDELEKVRQIPGASA